MPHPDTRHFKERDLRPVRPRRDVRETVQAAAKPRGEPPAQIRVLLVHSVDLFRYVIEESLRYGSGIEVTVADSDLGAIGASLGRERFDAVVVGFDHRLSSLAQLNEIVKACGDLPVVLCANVNGPALVEGLMRVETSACLVNSVRSEDLTAAIHSAIVQPDRRLLSLPRELLDERERDVPRTLTEREFAVLRLLGLGHTNRQIGRCLRLTESTVKRHLHSVFQKLGAHSRTDAIRKALHHGLLAVGDIVDSGD